MTSTRTAKATRLARIYVHNMQTALTRANIQGAIRQFDTLLSELLTERIQINARIRSQISSRLFN